MDKSSISCSGDGLGICDVVVCILGVLLLLLLLLLLSVGVVSTVVVAATAAATDNFCIRCCQTKFVALRLLRDIAVIDDLHC
jgi:hypothetical protein